MTPVRKGRKMPELLARQLVADILTDGLQAGDRLEPEATMVESYGVGRATVREALRILEIQGLISIRSGPGGGPIVRHVTPSHFADTAKLHLQLAGASYGELLTARVALESMMAYLVAENQDPEGLLRLKAHLERANTADLSSAAEFADLSHEFHEIIASASGNRVLNLLVLSLRAVYHGRLPAGLAPPETRQDVMAAHQEVAEAIFEGDSQHAANLMREHMVSYAERRQIHHGTMLNDLIGWD